MKTLPQIIKIIRNKFYNLNAPLTNKTVSLMALEIDNLDPLDSTLPYDGIDISDKSIFENAMKDNVLGILRCYTGFFDIFSELLQNSLDATEKKFRAKPSNYLPKIYIDINIKEQTVKVTDNGCGMKLEEFAFCFRPQFTFKKGQNLRGNKGVGATFLAYGYNFIKLQSKIGSDMYAATLKDGRQWAEEITNNIQRPRLKKIDFHVPELISEESGTSIEISLANNSNCKPKDLGWYGANQAHQWFDILRIISPLGGIYFKSTPFEPHIYLSVTDRAGNVTKYDKKKAEFLYPHEIPDIKEKDLFDIRKVVDKIDGDLKTKYHKIPQEYKTLQLIWVMLDYKEILAADYLKLELNEQEKKIIEEFQISIYASQIDSLETFGNFNEQLGVRQKPALMRGGIQLATDGMPQGDLIQITLNRQSGLQDYTFIIVHFKSGDPDTGRKNFQPELKGIAEKIATKITNFIILYRDLLRPDTGAIRNLKPTKDLHVWKKRLDIHKEANPIERENIHENFTYYSAAQEEQDVIAMYNQLVGCGILKGIYFYSTEYNEKYDSLFELKYTAEWIYSQNTPLGVRNDNPYIGDSSEPKVLEYKMTFGSLLKDFKNEKKFPEQIDLVVCWRADIKSDEKFFLKSLLLGKEGNNRIVYGATHQAFIPGISNNSVFEVIILEDLLNFIINPERELANQRIKYSNQ